MTRPSLLAYLQGQFATLQTTAGLLTSDDPTGFKPALDLTFTTMGVTPDVLATATVDDSLAQDAYAVADFFALQGLTRALAVKVNRATGPARRDLQQMFANTMLLLKMAQATMAQHGYGPQTFELGRLQLDILEPANEGLGGGLSPWGY